MVAARVKSLRPAAVAGLVFCWLAAAGTVAADPRCDRVAARGELNVLTINLLFSEIATREQRLADIARFMADHAVDVALLQEVVGGTLAQTASTARDLQDILGGRGLEYELRTAFEVGVPDLLTLANAVLSRCDIRSSLIRRLPRASEIEFGGETIKLARNVMMVRLALPGAAGPDRVHVYNTHLCASCRVAERQAQLDELLAFVTEVEDFLPSDNPVVLGGDLNLDRFRDDRAERPLYKDIVKAGFTDAYADAQADPLKRLCHRPEASAPDKLRHCTVGVSALDGNTARRVDYIFAQGFAAILESRVVFNPFVTPSEPTVSDHAGVFVRLKLP